MDERVYHPGSLQLRFSPDDPSVGSWSHDLHKFERGGVFVGMFNTDDSIRNFAKVCFDCALNNSMPIKLATKQSFLRQYDARFRHIFSEMYNEYSEDFNNKLIEYEHRNVDDMVS